MSVSSGAEEGQRQPAHSGGAVDAQPPDREALIAYSAALVAGLEALDKEYGGRVFLAWEDPVTFGAGHFVFYPMEGTDSRFAIEEQYTDTDWSDDERVATSWTWTSEVRVSEPPGCYPWQVIDDGEVPAGDYAQLMARATNWVQTTAELAARADAVSTDPVATDRESGPSHRLGL